MHDLCVSNKGHQKFVAPRTHLCLKNSSVSREREHGQKLKERACGALELRAGRGVRGDIV